MDTFLKFTHKSELEELKDEACITLEKMISKLKIKDTFGEESKKSLFECMSIMITQMKEETGYRANYYSTNRLIGIADILRELKKDAFYEELDIEEFYHVMRVIYICHTSLYKHKDFSSDSEFIKKISSTL